MAHKVPDPFPSTFISLTKYTSIIFYDEENPIPPKFSHSILPPYTILNLSANKNLSTKVFETFKLTSLPAILINNTIYYKDDTIFLSNISSRVTKLINTLLTENENIIFMKGTPIRPECKFTREVIAIMKDVRMDGKYAFFNVFEEEELRNDLKIINNWKTYPQIYLKNKFIGGLDVLKEMKNDGRLEKMVSEYVKDINKIH